MSDPTKNSDSEILSSVEYWDSVLENAKLPRINQHRDYHVVMDFMDSVLERENKSTLMEIGAGSSGWLPYFSKKYGYVVSGLDYSEIGCKIAVENLKMLNVKFDDVLCQDIFSWSDTRHYDVIFSYGVVEHFDHPEKVLKICHEHLNDGGIIITLIPNLSGLMGKWSQKFVPDIFKIHKVITREELLDFHLRSGFENIRTDYAGTFSIGVIPWVRSNHLLFRNGSLLRPVSLKAISALSKAMSLVERLTGSITSKKLSPYVISIMRKKTA